MYSKGEIQMPILASFSTSDIYIPNSLIIWLYSTDFPRSLDRNRFPSWPDTIVLSLVQSKEDFRIYSFQKNVRYSIIKKLSF